MQLTRLREDLERLKLEKARLVEDNDRKIRYPNKSARRSDVKQRLWLARRQLLRAWWNGGMTVEAKSGAGELWLGYVIGPPAEESARAEASWSLRTSSSNAAPVGGWEGEP